MLQTCPLFVSLLCLANSVYSTSTEYSISTTGGLGRRFDGIGGLSGGGATSKLLVNYPEKQRSEILDFLFKPMYGAALQILKVEIGGDDQSTDGTESSHMHSSSDLNFHRGYEWWLIKEAMHRNKDIKLYALPWTFPGWVANFTSNPYTSRREMANYVVSWILGAKAVHNITTNYIGMWNERQCDLQYILVLRQMLNEHNLTIPRIVACDDAMNKEAFSMLLKNETVVNAFDYIGVHYPGTKTPKNGIRSGKALWSSEDYSTFNDDIGAGCWARILNQNYVNGYMSSTTAWNLIASYYRGLPFYKDGLMTATQPWSGHYEVNNPIWITAHTTHFTQPGWRYLRHNQGVQLLRFGGSMVSLTDSTKTDVTVIIETMTRNHSVCIRPHLRNFTVKPQKMYLNLHDSFAKLTRLNLVQTVLTYDGTPSKIFVVKRPLHILNGTVALQLDIDSIYTLTTLPVSRGFKYPKIPASGPFPLPYNDSLQDGYAEEEEPHNLAPQTGVWQMMSTSDGMVARQVITEPPTAWCARPNRAPIAVIGDFGWENISVSVDVRIPSPNATARVESVFVALRANVPGCGAARSNGTFLWFFTEQSTFALTTDIGRMTIFDLGNTGERLKMDAWHRLTLSQQGQLVTAKINGVSLGSFTAPAHGRKSGFVALGAGNFGIFENRNLYITQSN